MIITTTQLEPKFQPITVSILCETQDELDAIVTLFQSRAIDLAVAEVWPSLKKEGQPALSIVRELMASARCSSLALALKNTLEQ